MAGIMVSSPGSEFGPCVELCDHSDCAQSRQWAELTTCSLCEKLIGYDRRFIEDRVHDWVHAVCLVDQVERERAALNKAVSELLPGDQESLDDVRSSHYVAQAASPSDKGDRSWSGVTPLDQNAVAMTGVISDGKVYTPDMTLIGPVVDFSVTCYLCGRLHGLSGWSITRVNWANIVTLGYYEPGGRYPFGEEELARLTAQPVRELAVCTDRAVCIDARRMQDLIKVSIARTASGRVSHVRRLLDSIKSVRSIALCGASTLTEKSVAVNLDEMCKRCEKINASEVTSQITYQAKRAHLDSLASDEVNS